MGRKSTGWHPWIARCFGNWKEYLEERSLKMNRLLPVVIAAALMTQGLFAQGDNPRAKPTDWEEINFEFNQAVIVDGFPSMLRLADLLKQHPDYKVSLVGNADQIGSNRYNEALSLRRANAVAQFLQKYGANANQIQVRGDGKTNLEVNSRNVNARFMNRRVVITVTAPDGTVIGDGTITAAINEFEQYARGQLGKIDNILTQLQALETEVRNLSTKADTDAIKQDTAAIRQDTTAIKQDTGTLVARPTPLTREETTQIAHEAADYALTQEALRNRKYSLVGADVGPTFGCCSSNGSGRTGAYSLDVFAKALVPFGNGKTPDEPGTHAVQVDGDWLYFHRRSVVNDGLSDGTVDVGLVNRFGIVQLSAFAQGDYVAFNFARGGAILGYGILDLDLVYRGLRFGVYGSKAFRDYANVSTVSLTPGARGEFLRADDQLGFDAAGAFHRVTIETSLGYETRHAPFLSRLPVTTLKIGFPIHEQFSMFAEADQNPTFQNINSGYRIVFGIEFGNMMRPSAYGGGSGVAPAFVPRPHYELLNR